MIWFRWLVFVAVCATHFIAHAITLVKFEAESGALGADWAVSNTAAPAYITVTTDGTGSAPSNTTRVATYTVTFPTPGTYQLYAHLRVGAGTFNDDSLFYGDGFGVKNPTNSADWILVNGLGSAGFNNPTNLVNTSGTLGSGVWKWVNLSVFAPGATFTVPATNLTQTFQIGARENGLDLDAFVFGLSTYTYTVSNLDNSTDGTPPVAGIDPTKTFQTIEGLGGAICFYNGWVTAHPYKLEIFTNAFAGLNLSMLRLGNWFRYQGTANFDPDAPGFVANANRILGRPVPVYMSSWSPPASLKSNGQVGNGGTLITNAGGGFAYTNFANYWYDAIKAYSSNGVNLTWASIQNEPDWVAGYDSCIFHPTEDTVNGTNYASYSKALDAVYQKLTNLPSPPKLLAPEVVHISYNDLVKYAATMNSNSFYGVAHHLYGDGGSTGDSFLPAISSVTNIFPNKPRFMTEYGDVFDMIECAVLIHNSLTVESVSGYNHWNLIWPGTNGGLIQIENPWNQSSWTNAPPGTATQSHGWWCSPSYWSLKHFSYFIQPGYRRVAATNSSSLVPTSAYLSPDGLRLVAVFINKDVSDTAVNVSFGSFPYFTSGVYQTAGTNKFQPLGAVGSQLTLPAQSLTTVVLERFLTVGPAGNPSPAPGATEVGDAALFSWTPGSNAVSHAVYLGFDSNAVAQATPGSPEFKGYLATNVFSPALLGGAAYYWRVDENAGVNTNIGPVWSFSTAATLATPVKVEAEAGTPGAEWGVSNSNSPAYLTISTDGAGNNPGSAARVAAYTVAFPVAGTYALYAHIRVGADGFADDSLFYGNGFGSKSPTVNANWILANGLAGAGYNNSDDVVTNYASGGGSAGNLVWKWVNLSQFTANAGFTVPVASLVQTFQIGGRENGLDLEKFVFGATNYTYTVAQLDAALEFNQSPSLAADSNRIINPGTTLVITNAATDPNLPGQTLAFTLLTAPTNATLTSLNASNALFIWRPLISQANSTNAIQVKVADNGSPSLSTTNNFVITVNSASQPALSSIVVGGQVSLSATGMIGPDYSLLISSNLMNWQTLFVTNPAVMPVTFTDTNRSDAVRFYRLQLGP